MFFSLSPSPFLLLFFGNEQQDITSLSQHFKHHQDLCPLIKLMDTVEYMNGLEQSRDDPRPFIIIIINV